MNKHPELIKLEKLKQQTEEFLKTVDKRLKDEQSKIIIICDNCKNEEMIGNIEYIQTHYYVSPYSCTSGDYWVSDEGQFLCLKCNKINRLYKKPEYEELKNRFKNILETFER